MAKGIIYVMKTVVPGLIKIGKTGLENYESRMYTLEHNGYFNVAGLQRVFAIEVEDYDEKESLLDDIFSKSRVPNSELFALDVDMVIQLLASFEGKQIYPKAETKEAVFDKASSDRKNAENNKSELDLTSAKRKKVPNGIYHLEKQEKGFGTVTATLEVRNGKYIIKKGSICVPSTAKWMPQARREAPIENNILMDDVVCDSPSTAAWVSLGHSNNGWELWKNAENQPIMVYRNDKN